MTAVNSALGRYNNARKEGSWKILPGPRVCAYCGVCDLGFIGLSVSRIYIADKVWSSAAEVETRNQTELLTDNSIRSRGVGVWGLRSRVYGLPSLLVTMVTWLREQMIRL